MLSFQGLENKTNGKGQWVHENSAQHHWSSGKSKPQRDATSHLLGWLPPKTQEIITVGEGVGKRKPLCATGGNVDSLCRTVWRRPLIFFLINNKTIIWSRSFTSGYLSEENKNTDLRRLLYPHIHCNIIYNSQDTESVIPTDGWRMDEVVCVYTYIIQP